MNGEPQTAHRFVPHALYSTRSNKIFLVLTVNKQAGIMAWHVCVLHSVLDEQSVHLRQIFACLSAWSAFPYRLPSPLSSYDSGRIDRWNSTSKASGPRWSGCHKIGPNTAALAPPDASNEEPIIVGIVVVHAEASLVDTYVTTIHPSIPMLHRQDNAPGYHMRR